MKHKQKGRPRKNEHNSKLFKRITNLSPVSKNKSSNLSRTGIPLSQFTFSRIIQKGGSKEDWKSVKP
jgi:hypothetical protein